MIDPFGPNPFALEQCDISKESEREEKSEKYRQVLHKFNTGAHAALNSDSFLLRQEASAIRAQVIVMISKDTPFTVIENYLDRALPQLERSIQEYERRNSDFEVSKERYNQRQQNTAEGIRRATTETSPFVQAEKKSSVHSALEKDPLYWEQRDEMLGVMACVEGAGAVANFVQAGINGWLKECSDNIDQRGRDLAKGRPLLSKRYEQLKKLPNKFVDGVKEVNDSLERIGKDAEEKIAAHCNRDLDTQKKCQQAVSLFEGIGRAISDSEPKLQSGALLEEIAKTPLPQKQPVFLKNSFQSVDNLWNLRSGRTAGFFASSAALFGMVNPIDKASKGLKPLVVGMMEKKMVRISGPLAAKVSPASYLNNKQYKTLETVFNEKKGANLSWRDVESLFKALGTNIVEGNGSRILVQYEGAERVFHRPHTHHNLNKYLLKDLRTFLTEINAAPLKK